MSLNNNRLYEFGNFCLNTGEKILIGESGKTSVSPKVLELFVYLLENNGRLISKEELIEEVWKGNFVEESNLTFTIRKIRSLIEDDARKPKYIETVAKGGYRFIADVKIIDSNSYGISDQLGKLDVIEEHSENNISPAKPRIKVEYFILLGLILLTGVIASAFLYSDKISRDSFFEREYKIDKISNFGQLSNSAISPDGKFIVFSAQTAEKNGLWHRDLETGKNTQILPPVRTDFGEISILNDNQTIIFAMRPPDNLKQMAIYRMNLTENKPEKIFENTQGVFGISEDEKRISFAVCNFNKEDYCSLFIADLTGENLKRIFTVNEPNYITDSLILNGNKEVTVAHGQSFNGSKNYNISKINVETGAEIAISKDPFYFVRNVAYLTKEKKYFVVGKSDANDSSRFWLMDETGSIKDVLKDSENYIGASFDRNFEKLVSTQVSPNFQLKLAEFERPENIRNLSNANLGVTFTPDGKLIYANNADGNLNLWLTDSEGNEHIQLTNSRRNFSPLSTGDGKYIFYVSNTSGNDQVWRMNSDGSGQTQITQNEGGYPLAVSPDGKFIYYKSALNDNLWRTKIDGDEEILILDKKSYSFTISPDGNFVAYSGLRKDEKAKTKVYSLTENKQVKEFPTPEQVSSIEFITWSADGKFLAYIAEHKGNRTLWTQDSETGESRQICELGKKVVLDFAISHDSKSFAVIEGNWVYDAVIIQGFK